MFYKAPQRRQVEEEEEWKKGEEEWSEASDSWARKKPVKLTNLPLCFTETGAPQGPSSLAHKAILYSSQEVGCGHTIDEVYIHNIMDVIFLQTILYITYYLQKENCKNFKMFRKTNFFSTNETDKALFPMTSKYLDVNI